MTDFPFVPETSALSALRRQARAFVRDQLAQGAFVPKVDSWLTGWDEDFTAALAEQGWIGMTIPREYGGAGATFAERFVVTEELLAAGAPVAAHWIADRQIAPSLLRFGTEAQKQRFLPAISRGECFFGIGMSEPDSGSDLASVRTEAVQVAGGWRVTGTKVWTSGAHRAHAFFVLARSSPREEGDRHGGLSQFIVDLHAPGVEVRPIVSMSGDHHFNEVFLDGVFVPDDMVLGTIGQGWHQVTSELGFERSGPERFLSTVPLLVASVDAARRNEIPADPTLGRHLARVAGLHHMSRAVAEALQRGEKADTNAAAVKLLGTALEGDIAESVDVLLGDVAESEDGTALADLLRQALLQRPGFTLRGGTTEILHGVVARGLGMR